MTADLDFDRCYAAVSGRDRRFDGQFVLAVRSTGIYCRPSCPARTPRPSQCTFFATSAAAHLAGYRACKRCLPEAVPGSPVWNIRQDVAGRAMRLIASGTVDREGVEGLASRLGYSSRHLHRLLVDELGAGALALARAQRAQTARHLLVSTAMRIADIAFAAGFASVRQFNETMAEVFGMSPTQVRATARRADRPDAVPSPGTVTLHLQVREPFDGHGLLAWFAPRTLAGVEEMRADTYTRSMRLPGGPATIDLTPQRDRVSVTVRLTEISDVSAAMAVARQWCDADADPWAVDDRLRRDPAVEQSVARVPGIRIPGAADGFEMLAYAILGQQVTVASARGAMTALVGALSEPLPAGWAQGDVSLLPLQAGAVAAHAHKLVRGPRRRTAALVAAAEAVAGGQIDLSPGASARDLTAALEAIPGIGPWTSHYVAMRVLGDPDVLLTGDVAARAGARALGLPATPRDLAHAADRHRPWRSYLMLHLWRAALDSSTRQES